MGQTTSVEEQRMHNRIQKYMGTYSHFATHLKEANEWYVVIGTTREFDTEIYSVNLYRAKLCPRPKLCRLEFRVVVNPRISTEFLPYVWRIADNVSRTKVD